jgi:hypothetical protein
MSGTVNGEAPVEFDPEAPSVEEPAGPKVIRQITLTQYEGGQFTMTATPTEGVPRPLADDLPGVKGILDYALRYIALQWELGEMSYKWDTQQRLMVESQQKVQPASGGRFPWKRH